MSQPFPIIVVPENARESVEQMGSKEKFWFTENQLGLSLYKIARSGTGEDWSEKAAEQFAGLLGLPHARYEFACWRNPHGDMETRGVVTPTLVPEHGRLISGNELLVAQVQGYPAVSEAISYRIKQHTLDTVLELIQSTPAGLPPNWEPPNGINTPLDLFVGYLLLDAWIGNTDRHHENWAYIEPAASGSDCAPSRYLAPTFDHASCLGRNEPDTKRAERLLSRDHRFSVAAYAAKARSALYGAETDGRPLTVRVAFRRAAALRPVSASVWRERLAAIDENAIEDVLERIPSDRLSLVAREFALIMLKENQRRLLESEE